MSIMQMSERDYWAFVARRPGMFIGRTTFAGLTAYIDGYDHHSKRHGGPGLDGWTDWLVARRGRDCNHRWDGHVLHLAFPDGWERDLTDDQEHLAINLLFELLDEFLAEREDSVAPSHSQA
jgi:hypothetical protein